MFRDKNREPSFTNLECVLQKKPPPRAVLFDFIIGESKERMLVGESYRADTEFDRIVTTIRAFDSGGYDFAPIIVRGLEFERNVPLERSAQTKSLNEGSVIIDRASYESYSWPEIDRCDFSVLTRAASYLHPDAKFVIFSHDGILENTIGIVGYEQLCLMLYEDEPLAREIFAQVGARVLSYYETSLEYDEIGAVLLNDDWGFNTQTMISPKSLRTYVFPWYKKIVDMVHKKGKYAILHSCGKFDAILDDIIDDMGFDGRHSYEDNILPVEKAYEALHGKIAVLGGIDVDFMVRSRPEDIYLRSTKMLERAKARGGYALGSGNSIPDFIPDDHYRALLRAALDWDQQRGSK